MRLALALLLVAHGVMASAQTLDRKAFETYVARSLLDFEVPGAAVAVVKDGEVVLAKGYGVRKLGETTPVDAGTLFAIASCSKAFTTATLAILVDEGKIDWDDPVIDHLPAFRLYDPYVTREITIRDLVTHRSGLGLGGGDLLWLGSDFSQEEIVHRIRYLQPASSFRSRYAYQNIMFVVAGQIIPAVAGKSWDEFVKERIFGPLGMKSANTSVTQLAPGGNWATPHARLDNVVQPVPYRNVDHIDSAGGINASVSDLTKWLLIQLGEGKLGNTRLYSEEAAREMWSAQTVIPIDEPLPPLAKLQSNFTAYGLGWRLRDYLGRKVVWHTGGLRGMTSMTTLVPSEDLGLVVLTNQETALPRAITYWVLDAYLGAVPTDWTRAYLEASSIEEARAAEKMAAAEAKRDSSSQPSLKLSGYVGRYRDAMIGDATIEEQNGRLILRFHRLPSYVADLEHWQYNSFKARWRDGYIPEAFVTFSLNPDGSIDEIKMAAVSPLTDFSFDYHDLLFRPVEEGKSFNGRKR